MSRKRHAARPSAKIDWLEHRTGYPSPEEREAIIERRNRLRIEFIGLVARDQSPDSPAGQRLVEKYGQDELNVILKQFDRAFLNDNIVETKAFSANWARSKALIPSANWPMLKTTGSRTCCPKFGPGWGRKSNRSCG